jgi:hypothetical protein
MELWQTNSIECEGNLKILQQERWDNTCLRRHIDLQGMMEFWDRVWSCHYHRHHHRRQQQVRLFHIKL